jgi:RimJ/RimL family protein N-acetyltransferase
MADLQTKRLRMVSWNRELVQAAIDDGLKIGQMLGVQVPEGFPSQPVRHHVLPLMLKALEQDPSVGQWSGMIIHVSDRILIGSMGFKSAPDESGSIEIGYDIIPEYQGRGYATEMAQALIQWAFEQPYVKRITAECLATNKASIRVLEKVGMKRLISTSEMLNWELTKR